MKQNKFFKFFADKSKLSMRSVRSGEEFWHLFISRGNFLLVIIALVIVLFSATLTIVAYTSILDLVPGYPGNRSRSMLVSSIAKLDSLEREVALWENYTNDLQMILDGRQPQTSTQADSARQAIKGEIAEKNQFDESLRREMALLEASSNQTAKRNSEVTFEMIAPVKGIIEQKFTPENGNYGVLIKPAPSSVALAVLDGTVVLNSWSPESGTTLAVQHAAGMMSIYKGLERSLKNNGERVKAGQGVGTIGSMSEGYISKLSFELWSSGNPVDPENYITF